LIDGGYGSIPGREKKQDAAAKDGHPSRAWHF
jgi:hypothetical protein